jgi:uncharacterized protein YutE (UPF0331/DUF86 family)
VADDVLMQNLASIDRMRAMVGFRNVAAHQYQVLDQAILRAVVEKHLGDFTELCRELSAE